MNLRVKISRTAFSGCLSTSNKSIHDAIASRMLCLSRDIVVNANWPFFLMTLHNMVLVVVQFSDIIRHVSHCVVRQNPYGKGFLAQCCTDYPGRTMPIMHACGFDEEVRPDAVPEPIWVVHDLFDCQKPLEQCRVKMLHLPVIQ